MTPSTLTTFVQEHLPLFDELANTWVNLGAMGFRVELEGGNETLLEKSRALDSDHSERSEVTTPLIVHGQQVGHLVLAGTTTFCDTYHCSLIRDAQLISEIITLNTEIEEFAGEVLQTYDQLVALYDLSRSLRKPISMDEVISISLKKAIQMLGASHATLALHVADGKQFTQIPAELITDAELNALCTYFADSTSPMIMRQGDARLPEAVKNVLFIPLTIRDRVQAGMYLFNKPNSFLSPDIKLASALAEQIGAKIENVLLHAESVMQARVQTEMELARQVQMSLLPKSPPTIDGLDIAAGSVAALKVGGDFYDFVVDLDHGGLTFMVGDVSGKGMPAALVMSMTRTMMRSVAGTRTGAKPVDIMQVANQSIYEDFTDLIMFVTAFVGHYHEGNQLLTYANAGHSPVIYCRNNQEPVLLEADGTAIGVLPDNLCENQTLAFEMGDVLVVATDGFAEAFDAEGEMYGYDRLLQLVKSLGHLAAQEIADKLFSTINEFASGVDQNDDQTLIVLKRV